MFGDQAWQDYCTQLDSVLTAFLDGRLSRDDAYARLVTVFRQVIKLVDLANGDQGAVVNDRPSDLVVHVDRFQNLMMGRNREDILRGSALVMDAVRGARGAGPDARTA